MFFGTFKFEATTENRAILLISTKLVQNYSFKEKILGHFNKKSTGFFQYMFKTIINFRINKEKPNLDTSNS